MERRRAIEEGNDMTDVYGNVLAAVIFAFLGIVVFTVSFVVIDRMTPYSLWGEIVERQNTALATLIGLVSIGLCLIIAAAIH
jgi:putative membrane protein